MTQDQGLYPDLHLNQREKPVRTATNQTHITLAPCHTATQRLHLLQSSFRGSQLGVLRLGGKQEAQASLKPQHTSQNRVSFIKPSVLSSKTRWLENVARTNVSW